MTGAISVKWISTLAAVTVFTVMLSLVLHLEREQIAKALQRRVVLAAEGAFGSLDRWLTESICVGPWSQSKIPRVS